VGDHRHIEEVLLMTMGHAYVLCVTEIIEPEPLRPAIGPEERIKKQRAVVRFERQRRPAEVTDPGQPQATE
jgi:hypothetical protein